MTGTREGTALVAGRRAHYAEAGSGPTAVLAAGLGLSTRFYEPTLRELARAGVHLVVPDLPGFGATPGPWTGMSVREIADWLASFADALGIERPAWLGHSVGCQVTLALAVAYPERVHALVLASPTGAPQRHRLVRQVLALPAAAAREPPGLLLAVARDYLRVLPSAYLGTWARAGKDRPLERAPYVRCPTLVLVGHRDPVVPRSYLESLRKRLPRAQLLEIPGGAHGLPRDAAVPFAAAASTFIRSAGLREVSLPAG